MTKPPSGYPPPVSAELRDGEALDLRAVAQEVCSRYRAEFPDEQERYGDAGMAWCLHDNQHIVNWAVNDWNGYGGLEAKLACLAGVLEARDFPLERLARDLEIAADVLAAPHRGLSETLATAASFVRSRPSFLSAPG